MNRVNRNHPKVLQSQVTILIFEALGRITLPQAIETWRAVFKVC